MTEMPQPVFVEMPGIPAKPKITLWHWVCYYAYNLSRKPSVYRKKKQLLKIASNLKMALEVELLPKLWQSRLVCPYCKDAYVALRSQTFVSIIQTILKGMECPSHPEPFQDFRERHQSEFELSEEIARWINGFSK